MAEVEVRRPIPLRSIPGIELSAIGTWHASTGVTTFTPEDMVNAVAALECPGVRNPVLKLGHDEEDSTSGVRWDGEPAIGWVGNMHMDGAKLMGDFMGMPSWLVDSDDNGMSVLASAYPDRSIEIRRPFVCQIGHTHPSVITAVAFLGVYPPGVGVLKSMQDVYAMFTEALPGDVVAASALVRSTIKLAADDEPRELTPAEKRAGTDFAKLQSQWSDELGDLLEVWGEMVEEPQREALAAQIATAVDTAPDDLGSLAVDSAVAAAALVLSMRRVAQLAAVAAAAEARRQGVEVDAPDLTDEDVQEAADAIAAAMAASTASSAGRQAAQLLGSGSGQEIATATAAYLAGLTDRFLRDQLGGALSAAQAIGRFKVIDLAPIGEYYASEVNDSRTCSACKSIDGTKFDDKDAARAAYGSGKYVACQGGARCRGTCVATWGDNLSAPTIRTTVLMGGPMPNAPGGTLRGGVIQASVSVEDISRQYYESAGYSMWITAMHVDPLELIASDDSSGKFFRIPVELSGDKFEFGEAQEVAINYVEVPVAAKALPHRWDSRKAALAAAGKAEDGADLKPKAAVAGELTGAAANLAGAPDGGAAVRKMAAAVTKTPEADTGSGSATSEQEGLSVDKAKIKEGLGLAADASDEEMNTALAALSASDGKTPAVTSAPTGTDPASLLAAIPQGSDAIVLDLDNYKALLGAADKGVKAFEAMQRGERDSFLGAACREGRFPVAKLDSYKAMWDQNPGATKSFVELMPKNAVPVMNVGFLGAEVDKNESDLAYDGMYPEVRRG